MDISEVFFVLLDRSALGNTRQDDVSHHDGHTVTLCLDGEI